MSGLYQKYQVEKLDDEHGKHRACEFFVLDLTHDVAARAAALAYANNTADPVLSSEIRERVRILGS